LDLQREGKEVMPYSKGLEIRIQKIVSSWKNTDSKKMFGGICHLLNGNMFCGVYKDFLILRLGEEKAGEALRLPFVKPFDITGRPMKGWVMVDEQGFAGDEELKEWLEKAKGFVKTLGSK
jgi:TfoX/Sxy family transcriptional regulator of competence genes